MRGKGRVLFAVGLALGFAIGCEVHTEVRTGGTTGPQAAPTPGSRNAVSRTPTPRVASGESAPTATKRGASELRPVSERELTSYRSLISGEYDRVVLDPKLVSATDNVFTESLNATVAALEGHAAKYDVAAVMASRPPCETAIETILSEQANDPIRNDEDDVQYQRRRESGKKGLEHFRKALGSPSDASRDDLKFAYRLFVTKFDDRGSPVAGIPRARSALAQRIDGVADKGLCHAKYLLVVNEWWKRQRAELDAKRQAGEAAKDVENRKAVLARRFAPVELECSENWRATSTKCAELPGLSDDERKLCIDACAAAAEQGFKKAFQNAHASCVENLDKAGPKNCELTKPAGSTISDDAVAKAIAACKTECATTVREEKAQAAKEHQECLGFCRDLKNGFCSMTERPKQPACIDRCIRIKCTGN